MCLPDVCSLKVETSQLIPADGSYHIVRFPFEADPGGEPYDAHGMHQAVQPDSYTVTNWTTDDRSGLIWPSASGWGHLYALMYWDTGDYTELRSRFVRDPLNLSTGYDSTCTEDETPTPGGQYEAKAWGMFVHPDTPVALMVRHNASVPVALTLAEFKMAINRPVL